jgi:hypothetical protein
MPHFRERATAMAASLAEINAGGRLDTAVLENVYKDAKDLFEHGVLDYPLAELVGSLKGVLVAIAPEIHRPTIGSANTWPELLEVLDAARGTVSSPQWTLFVKFQLEAFSAIGNEVTTQIRSFGKYFEEQPVPGSYYDLELVPVSGIWAAIAIDTGSDCGKGYATARSMIHGYSVFLITDGHVPYGYVGEYQASIRRDGRQLLMADAFNPSTRLELSGQSFLSEMRRIYASQSLQRSHAGVLVSDRPFLVSNRASIEKAVGTLPLENTGRVFGLVIDAIPEKMGEGLSGKINRLRVRNGELEEKATQPLDSIFDRTDELADLINSDNLKAWKAAMKRLPNDPLAALDVDDFKSGDETVWNLEYLIESAELVQKLIEGVEANPTELPEADRRQVLQWLQDIYQNYEQLIDFSKEFNDNKQEIVRIEEIDPEDAANWEGEKLRQGSAERSVVFVLF